MSDVEVRDVNDSPVRVGDWLVLRSPQEADLSPWSPGVYGHGPFRVVAIDVSGKAASGVGPAVQVECRTQHRVEPFTAWFDLRRFVKSVVSKRDPLDGASWEELRELAESHGVTLPVQPERVFGQSLLVSETMGYDEGCANGKRRFLLDAFGVRVDVERTVRVSFEITYEPWSNLDEGQTSEEEADAAFLGSIERLIDNDLTDSTDWQAGQTRNLKIEVVE